MLGEIELPPNKPRDSARSNETKLSKTREKYKQMTKVGSLNSTIILAL